ncbi:uncharacterized protein LOC141617793 [Silene latifolia]|uniref:uncharacterized protein LOC141617793 n=1 Tax=Silene latifolia TaxID=37657 RepID=UPI003D76BE71
MEVVKNLQVTVPFTELVTQVPAYAKFLKEISSKKRSFDEVETVAFTQECYAALQANSPPKLKDPGSFSIPCTIGLLSIDNAFCDLGASVSVMPYKICKQLNMTKLKCTNMTIQPGRCVSIKHPMGILEDVPVKIGKFFIPVDFVGIDIAEDSRVPIILGRPFLHTAGAIIDVRHGSLTNPPDAPADASYLWSKEVDEIERLIYGDEPPEVVYSCDENVDIEAELDALEAEIFKEKPTKAFDEASMMEEVPYLSPSEDDMKNDEHYSYFILDFEKLLVQMVP